MSNSSGAIIINSLPSGTVARDVSEFLEEFAKNIPKEKIPDLLEQTPVVLTHHAHEKIGKNVVKQLEQLGASAIFIPVQGNIKTEATVGSLPLFQDANLKTQMTAGFLRAVQKGASKVVLISSCSKGEGKSTTAFNIACGLTGEAGLRVVLLDANPDGFLLHTTLGVPEKPGLTDFLAERVSYQETIRLSAQYGFYFMTYGSAGPGRLEPFVGFKGRNFKDLLDSLQKQFDYVLVDSSSLFGPSDPMLIAGEMDGVLLVVECEKTRWEVLEAAEEKLRAGGAKPIGIILNKRNYYIPKVFYNT